MILDSRKGQELTKHLARPIVAELAPDEIEDFDDLAEDFFDDPRLKGDHTLGAGLDLLPDLVIILMFVSATLEHLLARNGSAPAKSLLERLSKAVVQGQEIDRMPWFSSSEFPPAFESASLKTRKLPESTRRAIETLLYKLLPIRVGFLFLGASPETRDRIRADREFGQIAAILRESPFRDRIEQHSALAVTPDEIPHSLVASRPHVLHFSGHGTDTRSILVENSSGLPQAIPGDSLVKLLQIFKDRLRVVVLNACHSEPLAKEAAAFVDAVIGMAGNISDDGAMSFSRGFYRALGHGEDLQRAFDLGCTQIELDGFSQYAGIPRLFALREAPRDIVLVEAAEAVSTP
jgi:hypothetical protein